MENRTERITLKVTPNMMERIEKISERMQINSTSLCAIWISEKVDELEQKIQLHEESVQKVSQAVFASIEDLEMGARLDKIRKLFPK